MTQLDFSKNAGLVTAIAVDDASGDVLMTAYMNAEAWEKTLSTGEVHYWSRSRSRLWKKGEESGNIQRVKEIRIDCDADAVLIRVEQIGGAACHTGHKSCFYRVLTGGDFSSDSLPVFDPKEKYHP